jgi:hypothetical protein
MYSPNGYFVYQVKGGPLRSLPLAWFAYAEDAHAWANEKATAESPFQVKQANGTEYSITTGYHRRPFWRRILMLP